ncbi:MAG: hypothetical protein RLY40_1046 [Pseudomonadota bacterium]|jgi:hypothetical protein
MYPEMDYYWMGPWLAPPVLDYTYPILLECDIELVKKTLQLILDLIDNQAGVIPEPKQLTSALNNYIKECNKSFLASERIRNFLLLGLFANLIVSFIVLACIPVTALSVSLVCFSSLILFSVNLFTLYQQMQGFDQEKARNTLENNYANFKEIIHPKNFKPDSIYQQEKILSPTSAPCLFPAQKISQNDELKHSNDENPSNDAEDSPPPKLSNHH